jgi:hypothetical protein
MLRVLRQANLVLVQKVTLGNFHQMRQNVSFLMERTMAHHFAGLTDIAELLGELQAHWSSPS